MIFQGKSNLKRIFLIGFLICLILLSSSTLNQSYKFEELIKAQISEVKTPKFLPPLPDSPFSINSLSGFQTYSSKGDGSLNNPFIIENYAINASGYPPLIGISIFWTTHYFEIRNCIISGGWCGISFQEIAPNTAKIYNNKIISNGYGIRILDSPNQKIESNFISDCHYHGISCYTGGSNMIIYNNTIEFCDSNGIAVEKSNNSYIMENKISNSDVGIHVKNVSLVEIEENILTNCTNAGIFLSYLYNCTINSNVLNKNDRGLCLWYCKECLVFGNNCSLNVEKGIESNYNEYLDFANNRLDGDGFVLSDDNFTRLFTLTINNTNNYVNGKLVKLFKNIDSLTITSNYGQIFFMNCSIININNILIDQTSQAITMFNCSDIIIDSVDILDCVNGIRIYDSIGISLKNCFFERNENGFATSQSILIDITDNLFIENYMGLVHYKSNGCLIKTNKFQSNTMYAIVLVESKFTTIYHNDFIDNGDGTYSQALDSSGYANYWYNITLQEGNYWSDWLGVGNYEISSNGYVVDEYPLSVPFVPELNQNLSLVLIIGFISLLSLVFIACRRR
ncbi:MAG: hypothetical protein HGN29_09315 [Asgard group archaeon]|nr:hypothetical protein [Asgard group archaeon]